MSVYPAPSSYPAIFNPAVFVSDSSGSGLSTAEADATYAKLAGSQTIVGEETFTGGILTNTIGPSSGTTVSIGQNLLYAEGSIGSAFDITAVGDVQGATLIATNSSDLADATATSLTCGSASFSNNVSFGTPFIRGSSWSSSSATTHTITSTALSVLGSNNWTGELKLFADDGTSYGGIVNYFLVRYTDTLSMSQVATSKFTNMSTFDAVATTTSGSSTITVTMKRTSTDTTGAKLSWLFTGAL